MNINKELEYIHAVLGTKHYFFAETSDHGVMLRLEDDIKCKYSFKGMTMVTAIIDAKEYIKQEISAGSLKDVDLSDDRAEDTQEKEKTDRPNILNKFKRKKVKKVICDICDKEIDVNMGMSAYEGIKVDKKYHFGKTTKPEIIKVTLDFCAECSEEIEQHFKELKKGGEVNGNK